MKHEEIVKELVKKRPGSHWNLRGDKYEGLEWLNDVSTKPKKEELEDK